MIHARQTILAVSLGFALIICTQTPAWALDPPREVEIASALGVELPTYWSIASVEISASVNDGDEISPHYRQRFVANAVPKEELYLPAVDIGAIGPFGILVTTRTTTQAHKLYGVATSVLALGKWSTELVMENSIKGLGIPRSLYSGPVVVAGSADADEATAKLLKTRELMKTVAEGIARTTVSTEALKQLAMQEQEALKAANRQRLEALEEKYEQERATIAAAADRERSELEAAGRQRLDALKAKLKEDSTAIETMATAADRERNRLIQENQRRLAALKAKHEGERAAVTATAATLKAVSEAEAETAAHKRLVAALAVLAEERERATEIAEQVVAAEMKEKTARYDALLAALRSENISQRNARFDLALTSGDELLKTTAIAEAMKSGDDGLQAKALAALIAKSPRIGITIQANEGDQTGNQLFEITSFDEKSLTFTGNYFTPMGDDPDEPNGTGSVQRDKLSLSGRWKERRQDVYFNCTVNARVDPKGALSGTISCAQKKWRTRVLGQVEVNL